MSLRLFLFASLLAAAPAASAQTGSVTARVVDAESGLPLPTATASVLAVVGADTTFVAGAAANIDGVVRVENVEPGAYRVVVSFVGYEDRAEAVEVDGTEVDLGTVGLDVEAEALQEVRVTAERTQVQTRIDRTVYDTADDPVAEGGTATDVLSTLPSVDVDIDGNVSLRGSGNVAVFINGRPAPVSGEFLASYLQSLPAGVVERVEVIPNPSAAFEPDGVGGIINIVLKEDAEPGLGGTLTARTDSQGGYAGTAAATYGRGPWSLAATYGYRNEAGGGSGTSFRINRYEAAPTRLFQNELEDESRTSHLLNLSADYSLSRATTITSQVQVGTRGGGEVETNTARRVSEADDLLVEFERVAEEYDDGRSADVRLGVRHTFGEGHSLVVEGRAEGSDEDEDQRYNERLLGGAGDLETPQRIAETEAEREAAVQVDYTVPFAGLRLDAGYKGDWEREARGLFSESADALSGAFVADDDVNNEFEFDQVVHAVYAQLAREWGPFGVQAGLRFETARTTFDLLTTGEQYDNDYANLFPSAFLSFAPTEATTFKTSYSRRVNRPRTWWLNPFQSFDDPLNIRIGNPELEPEYVDAFEAGVTQFVGWGSLSLTPYYRRTTNEIDRISTVRDDGVTVRRPENIDSSESYGVEFISSFEGVAGLGGYVSVEGFRIQTEGTTAEADLSNDAFGWGGRLNASYRLGDRLGVGPLDLQATARYSAPIETAQGRRGARSWVDLAFRQRLFDDRASLTLQFRDPLGMAGWEYTLDQPSIYQEFERDWGARQVGLTFSYRLGNQEPERERGGQGDGDFEGEEF